MATGRVVVVTGAAGGIGTQLANCAGYFPFKAFHDMTTDDFAAIVGTNLVGTSAVTRAVVPLMPGRGWGRIADVGSGSVFDPPQGQAHHVSAKAGVLGLTRALARDQVAEDLVGPVFLSSDDAGFITGQTLDVDGGMHLL